DLLKNRNSAGDRRRQTVSQVSSWHWDAGRSQSSRSTPSWSQPRTASTNHTRPARERERTPEPASNTPQFRTGQKVQHARFGTGIVIESKPTGNDEEVTVAFKDVGIKKLAAS